MFSFSWMIKHDVLSLQNKLTTLVFISNFRTIFTTISAENKTRQKVFSGTIQAMPVQIHDWCIRIGLPFSLHFMAFHVSTVHPSLEVRSSGFYYSYFSWKRLRKNRIFIARHFSESRVESHLEYNSTNIPIIQDFWLGNHETIVLQWLHNFSSHPQSTIALDEQIHVQMVYWVIFLKPS